MTFSEFVESVIETPICSELKQYLNKLYKFYIKYPEKCVFYLEPTRGSAKNNFMMLLPLFLKMYEEYESEEQDDKNKMV